MTGYQWMPKIVSTALPECSAHLWSLYWLARITKGPLVELGVRSGDSTRALLASAMDTGSFVWSVDQDGDAYHVREVTEKFGINWPSPFWETWKCITGDSAEAADGWDYGSVGLCFVDTSHDFATTWKEIRAWAPKIRPGGIMAFHDVGLTEAGRDGVLPALKAYADLAKWPMEAHLHIAEGDCGMGWITKPGGWQ